MTFPLLLREYFIHDETVTLFEPERNAIMDSYHKGLIPFPYWSQVWPAAIGLARFLRCYPHYTLNRHVLELAAGLGLPSMIAAHNAASVVASDYVAEALTVIQQTAVYNKFQNMQVRLLDWHALPTGLYTNVLLLSDVSYDAQLFEVQEKVIRQFLKQGTIVIISTPQRLIAKEAIRPLLSVCKHQEEIAIMHSSTAVIITVMVLQEGQGLLQ